MRKLQPQDFIILQLDINLFRLKYRERFFFFFYRWFNVTYLHLGQEYPMEFKTAQEAIEFIKAVIE